jgi:hypothetical protein
MMAKKDQDRVVWVGIEVDVNRHALLPPALAAAVTDLADRKMVAAILAAQTKRNTCTLVNACDTDWLNCEGALVAHGIQAEHLLEHEWLRPKWETMRYSR